MRVAFFGLGIMGRPMAGNLAKAGHEVVVWNRTPGKGVAGARGASSPREAVAQAEVVWVCVSNTAAVEHVLFGEDGAESSLKPGMVVVDSSTISPAATRRFAQRVEVRGADYVDAPLTGSKAGAEGGTLIFMAGGKESVIRKLDPLWKAMGKEVRHMGEIGLGQAAKLALNLMIAVTYQGFAEGLTLATRQGIAAETFLGLVQSSMVRSGVVDYKAPFVLRRDFSPNFPLRLMHKDLHLMLDAAQELGLKLPALTCVDGIYEEAVRAGQNDLDYAATIALLEKANGQ